MIININPHLSELPVIDYRACHEAQGNLKTLSRENYERLRNTLQEQGQLAPFLLWLDPATEHYMIIDGHQRKKLFLLEKVTPFERPYLLVPGESFDDAKKAVLVISSQYGTATEQGFNEFTFNLPQEWIQHTINFDAISKQFEKSLPKALTALPEDIQLKAFSRTHILLSFPPEKLIEIQEHLDIILSKSFVESEQG